jgi:hypothetical protein
VFIDRGSVVVLARSTDWPQGAARDAVRTLVDPVWTRAHVGVGWIDARLGSQTFSQLEGLDSLALTTRGRLLLLANDPSLLASVLDAMVRPAVLALPTGQATSQAPGGWSYAAGFRHGLERERFVRVTRFIDHAAETADGHEPFFFSENVASLSNALSRVDSASIVVQDRGATVSQTVTYRLGR